MSTGDYRNPDWEPSDAEHAALMEDFRRVVLWQKAMTAKGIRVLAMHMTPAEEHEAVERWWQEEGRALHEAEASR